MFKNLFVSILTVMLMSTCAKLPVDTELKINPDHETETLTIPTITTQPASQTVTVGQSATFSVGAIGNPAPSYQWKKDGVNISGATSAGLTISNTISGDAGNYSVEITNSQGSVTSSTVTLTVKPTLYSPIISTQPTSQTVTAGQSATFSVVASGNPSVSYQWKKNGVTISGATTASLTISNSVSSDAGSYSVVITNSQGNVTSSIVTLTVNTVQSKLYGMKYISGGTFQMGDATYATPIHTVTVSSFYMDSTEVTQAEYQRLMGVNPSNFTSDTRRPVERVTWFDAVLYSNARSKSESKDTVYSYTSISWAAGNGCTGLSNLTTNMAKNGYRLPTEAEWEFACRGGTTTDWYWTNSYDQTIANNYLWNYYNSNSTTHPVATKLKNGYGLYDMAGNVWEWCNDWYGDYTSPSATNPIGPTAGSSRVLRGGFFEQLRLQPPLGLPLLRLLPGLPRQLLRLSGCVPPVRVSFFKQASSVWV